MASESYDVTPVRYASPDGGWVRGVLGVPHTGGRHPAVIVMHGLPGTAESTFSGFAIPMVERGVIALAIAVCLFDRSSGLGACGDWGGAGATRRRHQSVERAWLSGIALAGRVLGR